MISFVIPAHNEERLLGATLESCRSSAEQFGEAYEIVVVDDASTDHTSELARARGARVITVNLRQISAVRNAGAKAAVGDRLFFVDADTVVPSAVLDMALQALGRGVVGGGAAVKMDRPIALWVRLALLSWHCTSRVMRWAAGCFIFVRRDVFEAVGGFDQRYYVAEEIFFSSAVKRQGRFVILREAVITSGRKAIAYGVWEMGLLVLKLLLGGPAAWRRRDGLEMWYQRRADQEPPAIGTGQTNRSNESEQGI